MTKNYVEATIRKLLNDGAIPLESKKDPEPIRSEEFRFRVFADIRGEEPIVVIEFNTAVQWIGLPLAHAKEMSKAIIAASKSATKMQKVADNLKEQINDKTNPTK